MSEVTAYAAMHPSMRGSMAGKGMGDLQAEDDGGKWDAERSGEHCSHAYECPQGLCGAGGVGEVGDEFAAGSADHEERGEDAAGGSGAE